MSQKQKGARLWLRPAFGTREPAWYIKDGGRRITTGCAADDIEGAERALALYLATKAAQQVAEIRDRDPANVVIADALSAYWQAKRDEVSDPKDLARKLSRLNDWWGDRPVGDVCQKLCQKYAKERGGVRAPGHELAYLRAAIKFAARERMINYEVPVWVPPLREPRERWLTRGEAARLIWSAWRYREVNRGSPGRYPRKHLAIFILVGVYTGTRSSAICSASFEKEDGRGWIDLQNGLFYRAGNGEAKTNKRKPAIRLPEPLLAHLRRWKANRPNARYLVEWGGKPVSSVKKAFASVRADADLGQDVTPHTLRHTCATWMMQGGADKWEAAGFLGMSLQMLEKVYGHHHPDNHSSVHRALRSKRSTKRSTKPNLKVVNSG